MYEVAVRHSSSVSLPHGGSPLLAICPCPLTSHSICILGFLSTHTSLVLGITNNFPLGTSHIPIVPNILI